jgi:FlaA1/EpsC-like NDP-sugar epimerase
VVNRVRVDVSQCALDALLVAGAYFAMLLLRFDAAVPDRYLLRFGRYLPLAVVVHIACGWAWGLNRQVWRHASVREAQRVLLAGATALAILVPANLVLDRLVPFSVALLGPLLATLLVGTVRFQSRLFAFRRPGDDPAGLRILVVGAGEAGAAIVREMQRDPAAGFRPVALLDDDPRKLGHSMLGVPIVGSVDELPDVVERLNVHRVLLAVPTAGQSLVRRVAAGAEAADVPVLVVPELGELIRGRVTLHDVRHIRIEDLIGRQEVKTDFESVVRLLAGRRVLITGGGGSIGAEIARQVAECSPERLLLLDNDETHLHEAAGRLDTGATMLLADVRDGERIARMFERFRPEIVFHAAAHKHVPVLEEHPCEAIATNLLGTANVVAAAAATGVARVVFISTDKAVQPSSVMGASKWLGEQLVLARAPRGSRYCAVRFGNVLGSRGSVVPTFYRQIASGGPVTVTDAEMTRFFMSIEEAVQLVLQAAVFAEGGEVFMLEMGEAVNILSLAKRMIRLSGYAVGKEIPIEIVGPRPGEKYAESLHGPDEKLSTTEHEAIVRVDPVRLPAGLLERSLVYFSEAAARYDDEAARALVRVANGSAEAVLGDDAMLDLIAAERSEAWNRTTI